MNTLILTGYGLADSPQDGSVQSSKFPALLWRGEGGRNDDGDDDDDDDDGSFLPKRKGGMSEISGGVEGVDFAPSLMIHFRLLT